MKLPKFLLDKHGNQTLSQRPNLPLIVGFIGFLLSRTLPYGQLRFTAELIYFGALFTWAWLELFQGDSPFRRAAGAFFILILILSRI